jgi:hypothetical protein
LINQNQQDDMPNMTPARLSLLATVLLCVLPAAHGSDGTPQKSGYTLFNPTPRTQLRELSADRPDVTESAYTVDAGHFQLEMSFVDFVYDDEGGVTSRTFTVAPMNLKVGLLNHIDVQLVLDPCVHTDDDDQTNAGFGDTQLRFKLNLWGNDGGETALAVMPFVKFPTAADDIGNDHFEGGLIFPFAAALPAEFSLGMMGEFDIVYVDEDDDYTAEFLHTVCLGHDLIEPLAAYVEYIGVAPLENQGRYRAFVGAGLTFGLNDDTQLDVGVIFGLTDDTDDFNAFTGITIRI